MKYAAIDVGTNTVLMLITKNGRASVRSLILRQLPVLDGN